MRFVRPFRVLIAVLVAGVTSAALALPALPSPGAGTGFYIAEFERRITDASRARLERTGVMIVDYEPKNSYLVWAQEDSVAGAGRVSGIRAVRPLLPERKLHDSLPASGVIERLEVTVFGPAISEAVRFLSDFGSITSAYSIRADGLLANVRVAEVSASLLQDIADHPAVLFASRGSLGLVPEDEATDQIVAGNINYKENTPVPEYLAWLKKVKLNGAGVKVAIVDTGVDALHPSLSGRIADRIDYSHAAEPTDGYGHGTHVAGIVGGMPDSVSGQTDARGFLYGLGVAPRVEFVDQNAIAVTGYGMTSNPVAQDPITEPWPPREGLQIISADSWRLGARMWNSSWHTGEGNRVGYIATVRITDEMSRNADFGKNGSEQFLMVFSAGNAGASGPTVPHEAKNIIAVGATNSGRAIPPSSASPDIDQVAGFSSKGPTKDGRIFPTVAAPGAAVISARSTVSRGGLCFETPADPGTLYYSFCSGTSMAAPHVTGSAALIHQWWKKRTGDLPSPALVKALLVNSARDIGLPDIPNISEGWGRVNLSSLFGHVGGHYVDQSVVFGGPREQKTYEVKVGAGEDLKVTLAWSDAPGKVDASPALVNDLDLVVERIEGARAVEVWRGNVFEAGKSVKGGKPDRLNNLENVYLFGAKPGTYRITVNAFNVPGDGIPANADKTDQDYALVVRAI